MTDADVLVVGAGSAGAAAARFFAERGRRVTIVDKRPRGETGARWVNAVPLWCFDEAGVERPRGEETPLGDDPHTFHVVGPARRGRVAIHDAPVAHVDMRRFVSRMLDRALAAGADLRRGHLEALEEHRDRVTGAWFTDGSARFTVRARLVVDATGLGGMVRRLVPALVAACPHPEPLDRCSAAEHHHEVRDPEALREFLARHGAAPGDAIAFSGIAGGYSTLTLFTRRDLREISVLTGSIPALGFAAAPALHARFVANAKFIGPAIFGGAGAIPLRRPFTMLGARGVALVGDAACQVYSSHGSGVGMGLLGARALADAAAAADDPGGDATLARYGASFRRAHGGLLAASDAFRRFIQGLGPAHMDALLESGLLDEAMARAALTQRPTRPSARFALAAPLRAFRAPEAAVRFAPLAARSVLLDRLGPLTAGAAIDRFIEPLVGRASPAAEGAWSLPES